MDNASMVPRDMPFHLLEEITNGFSEERKLGSGACGKVYMGVHKDGEKIAVKMLYDMPGLDDEQFHNEFNHLARLQHENIVGLVGYCYEIQKKYIEYKGRLVFADKINRALCFEYMHSGSLDNYLSDEYDGHDWHTRYAIIKGLCKGLKYLHEELEYPIYHLDLKPANILLDANMTPKIADFGLSRLFGEEQTRITKSFIGTIGYLPPEYIERNVISNKLDIFSLGVVIIKIMTGPKGYSKSAEMSSQQFIELVHRNWRNRLQATSVYGLELYSKQVKGCIEIALSCVEANRHKRPSIGHIVDILNETEILRSEPGSLMDQVECEILKGPHGNLQGFLDAVDLLRNIEGSISSSKSYSNSDGMLSHVNALLCKALVRIEGEFQKQLSQHSKPIESGCLFNCLPSTIQPSSEFRPACGKSPSAGTQFENHQNSEVVVHSLPALIEPKFVPLIANLAQQLVQAGCQQRCSEIYSEARASALELTLKNLGVEKLSKDEVQEMPWEILVDKLGNWIHFMQIAVKILFTGERLLCHQVFVWNQSSREECFAAITENNLAMLLSFGEAIIMSKRSPEILFVLLDMYGIMCELQTEIDDIFVGEACSQMRESALRLTKCLAQAAQKTFSDFKEAVEKDATESFYTDGTVHPLTVYIINYVKFLFEYKSTLTQLYQEYKREDGTDELAAVTMSVMQGLQNNLVAKAKEYKDPALMHIFMMNNIHHIVKSIHRSEVKDLLDDDWIPRHRKMVQKHANQYRSFAWSKLLQCLSGQGLSLGASRAAVTVKDRFAHSRAAVTVKDRFRSFNMLFEEIYQRQCGWSVPDSELRESVKLMVAEILLPAYRAFIERFERLIQDPKAPGKYVKHTPEELELFLGNLFEGNQEHAPAEPSYTTYMTCMPFYPKGNEGCAAAAHSYATYATRMLWPFYHKGNEDRAAAVHSYSAYVTRMLWPFYQKGNEERA